MSKTICAGGFSGNDRLAVRRIQAGLAVARREGRLIDLVTARLIAASVHRGLGSGLRQFAATGRLPAGGPDYQVLRLELDLTGKDEPEIASWVEALKLFLTGYRQARRQHPAGRQHPTNDNGNSPQETTR